MRLPGRHGGGAPVDWLIVGLGNPGAEYNGSPHNIGFEVAREFAERRGLGRFKSKYGGLYAEGNRVAVLLPQTYMNESGRSAGPARGALKVELDHVVAVHDELDLKFGEIRTRMGGGRQAGSLGANAPRPNGWIRIWPRCTRPASCTGI